MIFTKQIRTVDNAKEFQVRMFGFNFWITEDELKEEEVEATRKTSMLRNALRGQSNNYTHIWRAEASRLLARSCCEIFSPGKVPWHGKF